MKTIITASLIWLCCVLSARAEISDRIALYGEAKYNGDFKSFAYVNPDAP